MRLVGVFVHRKIRKVRQIEMTKVKVKLLDEEGKGREGIGSSSGSTTSFPPTPSFYPITFLFDVYPEFQLTFKNKVKLL